MVSLIKYSHIQPSDIVRSHHNVIWNLTASYQACVINHQLKNAKLLDSKIPLTNVNLTRGPTRGLYSCEIVIL